MMCPAVFWKHVCAVLITVATWIPIVALTESNYNGQPARLLGAFPYTSVYNVLLNYIRNYATLLCYYVNIQRA